MKKVKKLSAEQLLKIKIGASRNSQKEQGFFDGRFVQRSIESKKIYNRKRKDSFSRDESFSFILTFSPNQKSLISVS